MKRIPLLFASLLAASCAQEETSDSENLREEILNSATPNMSFEGLRSGSPVGTVTLVTDEVPDFPESVFTAGRYLTMTGPASFAIAPGQPAELSFHDRVTGEYEFSIDVPYPSFLPPGAAPNSLSVATPGALGDIYVNQPLVGIYRINSLLGFAEVYSTNPVPDIAPCFVGAGGDCSASPPCPSPAIPGAPPCDPALGLPPLPNSILMTEDGTAWVTDSFQGALWKVPASTKTHELVFSIPELQGNIFSPIPLGANGMAKGPDGKLYIANSTGGPAFGGAIYRMDFEDASTIELVQSWAPFQPPGFPFPLPQGPDGLRFDVDGNLWVSMAFTNEIAKLTLTNGQVTTEERFGTDVTSPIQFNQPSELHLDSVLSRGYVGNHALEPPAPSDWSLFKVSTGVRGEPLEKPWNGWDCNVHDCNVQGVDPVHAGKLIFEELFGL